MEHIKGEDNCLPDFLSREYIQTQSQEQEHVFVIVTEWDLDNQQEVLRTIREEQSWEEYKENWKPT